MPGQYFAAAPGRKSTHPETCSELATLAYQASPHTQQTMEAGLYVIIIVIPAWFVFPYVQRGEYICVLRRDGSLVVQGL